MGIYIDGVLQGGSAYDLNAFHIDGSRAWTADQSVGGHGFTNLAAITGPSATPFTLNTVGVAGDVILEANSVEIMRFRAVNSAILINGANAARAGTAPGTMTFAGTAAAIYYDDNTARRNILSNLNGSWTWGDTAYQQNWQGFAIQIASTNQTTITGSFIRFTATNHVDLVAHTVVNGTSPDVGAILDIQGTDGSLFLPRLTTTQKNAIGAPAEGMLVMDVTLHAMSVYQAGSWKTVTAT
jgi:hypothetical protein